MKQNKLREQIAEQFIAALQEDKLPWHAMWFNARPENAITGKRYRGINSFWLSFIAEFRGYSDNRWCTFKQASEKGWHVKKGEHATQIEYWRLFDKKQKKYIESLEARMIIEADPDREKDIILSCRTYSVFNGQQIEGIPELLVSSQVDIESVRAQRDVLLRNMELGFHEGGTEAFYRPSTDSITMPPDKFFKDSYGYMSTFLHECGHATGHSKRLNRNLGGHFGSDSYAKEELRAEIASAFTSQALGFGREAEDLSGALDNHKAYIQSWIRDIKDQPNELFAAIKDAEKISDYLLEKGEFFKENEVVHEAPAAEKASDSAVPSVQSQYSMEIVDQHSPDEHSTMYAVRLEPGFMVEVKVCDTGLMYVMENADGSTVFSESVADYTFPDYQYDTKTVLDLVEAEHLQKNKSAKPSLDEQITGANKRVGKGRSAEPLDYDRTTAQKIGQNLAGQVDVMSPQEAANTFGKAVRDGDKVYFPAQLTTER